jgi:hypothetical protein
MTHHAIRDYGVKCHTLHFFRLLVHAAILGDSLESIVTSSTAAGGVGTVTGQAGRKALSIALSRREHPDVTTPY